jgi:type 1 fimbriae regulatory protein FimB
LFGHSTITFQSSLEADPLKPIKLFKQQTLDKMITQNSIAVRPRRERSREYLTPDEVSKLLAASRNPEHSRNPERDYCLLLLMFRHGLRTSEACQLRLSDIDLNQKILHVRRLKNGKSTTHPLYNGEVKAVKDWLAARQEMTTETPTLGSGDTLFISERRGPLSRATVWVLIQKYATAAGLSALEIHPHMLRHSCGYNLANRGADTRLIQDYLGHRQIQHTVKYTELSSRRFEQLF